jgi:hypothetical protein
MRCCGRDHFDQCTEDPKCFVCAGNHEGSKYECTAECCGKGAGLCEHQAAKCANCEGPHPATSRRCPERRSNRQIRQQKVAEMRSSPPATEPAAEWDDLSIEGDRVATEMTPADPDQGIPPQVIPIVKNNRWIKYYRYLSRQEVNTYTSILSRLRG